MEVEKDLRDGDAKVFDTEKFTVDGDSLENLAEENDDFKKFAKNIKDGEYRESVRRSAPLMDFYVDGIEESTYDYLSDGEDADETSADVDDADTDDESDTEETSSSNEDEEDTEEDTEESEDETDSGEDTEEEDDGEDTQTRSASGRYDFAQDNAE